MADFTLTTGSPTSTQTGLTEGASYAFSVGGPCTIVAKRGAEEFAIWDGQTGSGVIPILIGTTLKFTRRETGSAPVRCSLVKKA